MAVWRDGCRAPNAGAGSDVPDSAVEDQWRPGEECRARREGGRTPPLDDPEIVERVRLMGRPRPARGTLRRWLACVETLAEVLAEVVGDRSEMLRRPRLDRGERRLRLYPIRTDERRAHEDAALEALCHAQPVRALSLRSRPASSVASSSEMASPRNRITSRDYRTYVRSTSEEP